MHVAVPGGGRIDDARGIVRPGQIGRNGKTVGERRQRVRRRVR
jgi:hypothetical protein